MDHEVMDGAFWRAHALEDLLPLWDEHAPDEEYGAFHTSLSRRWEPTEPTEKIPAMISRQVFAFSSGYLLSGDAGYLAQASRGVDYLLEHAWDDRYGGWFDRLTRAGEPRETTKSVQLQLYTNVGLTQYFLATGDKAVLEMVRRSLEIRRTCGRDHSYGGYVQQLGRDLSVVDDGKNKHAHYGYVGSHSLNMYLATRDAAVRTWARELCDLSIDRQMDDASWIYGFGSEFDRQWRRTPDVVDGEAVLSVGAQLTAALAFLRLYHQCGETKYLEQGMRIADNVHRNGWNGRGYFPDRLGAESKQPLEGETITSWIQFYGAFLQLHCYHLTEEEHYLERFRDAERFYLEHLLDHEYGGVFKTVDARGMPGADRRKAGPWNTAYHEVEHALLTHLYLNLYVNGEPTVLHFQLDGGQGGTKHYVSPVDDPGVAIADVTIDGEPWSRFDATERSVTLPPGDDLAIEVTLDPVRGT